MILQEFKRCWKSKLNIVIVALMSIPIYSALADELYHVNEKRHILETAAAWGEDISYNIIQLEGMNGLFHFEQLFMLHTGFLFFAFVIFVIGAGINVSGSLFSSLKTSYGINIVTRTTYNSYLRKTIFAQFLYMVTFLLAFFLVVFIVNLFLFGGPFQTPGGSRLTFQGELATSLYLLILLAFVLYAVICKALLILVASLSFVFLKNKYIIQFAPVAFFVGVYIFAFFVWNLGTVFQNIASALMYEHYQYAFTNLFRMNHDNRTIDIFRAFFYPLFLFVIFIIFYILNAKKFSRNYLK